MGVQGDLWIECYRHAFFALRAKHGILNCCENAAPAVRQTRRETERPARDESKLPHVSPGQAAPGHPPPLYRREGAPPTGSPANRPELRLNSRRAVAPASNGHAELRRIVASLYGSGLHSCGPWSRVTTKSLRGRASHQGQVRRIRDQRSLLQESCVSSSSCSLFPVP